MTRLLRALTCTAACVLMLPALAWAQRNDVGSSPIFKTQGFRRPQAIISASSVASNGAPTEPERIFRDAVPSDCSGPKAFPGVFGTPGPYAYTTFTYQNTGGAGCVTFTFFLQSVTGAGNPSACHLTAYSGAFNPAALATGYLGDVGSSPEVGAPVIMSLNLAASQTITFVVNQNNATSTSPPNVCTYVVDASNLTVPMLPKILLPLLAAAIVFMVAMTLRRRPSFA